MDVRDNVTIRLNHETGLFRVIRNGQTVARVEQLENYKGREQGDFIRGTVGEDNKVKIVMVRLDAEREDINALESTAA